MRFGFFHIYLFTPFVVYLTKMPAAQTKQRRLVELLVNN